MGSNGPTESHLLNTLLWQRCLVKTKSQREKQSEERQKMAVCTSFEITAFFLPACVLSLHEQYHKRISPPSTSSAGEEQQLTRVHCSESCRKCPWLSRAPRNELWTSNITGIRGHQNSKCLPVLLAPPSFICMCVFVHVCVRTHRSCVYCSICVRRLPQVHFRYHSPF